MVYWAGVMCTLELGMLLSEQVDDTCFNSTPLADLCHHHCYGWLFMATSIGTPSTCSQEDTRVSTRFFFCHYN